MLAFERHREIMTRVEKAGSVRVTELAQALSVTEETIRRDLDKLGKEGMIIRIHGGALPMEGDHHERPLEIRKTQNLNKKRAIAAQAVHLIREGEVIALDASTTAHELARIIPDIPLTVVTNSLVVLTCLLRRIHVTAVITGGILHRPSQSFTGSMAEESLTRFNINKLFFSSMGVDLKRGLSVANHEHARMKRAMMDLAEESYLLADSSKFGIKSVEFFAKLKDVNRVITDHTLERKMLHQLKKMKLSMG